jgi:hypothetical protein
MTNEDKHIFIESLCSSVMKELQESIPIKCATNDVNDIAPSLGTQPY